MKRSWKVALTGLAATAAVAGVVQAEIKVGVVNYSLLLQESPQAKAAQEALRLEVAPKQRELQALQASLKSKEEKLQKDAATMTADQRTKADKELRDGNRDYQAKLTAYQEDINTRQNEELSRLQAQLIQEVQNYAQAQKFDLVLADGVIYANGALDITNSVLTSLQAAKPAAAPASK